MSKAALVTGILGQDGAYLSQLLLKNGYRVYGTSREGAAGDTWRLDELGITGDVRILPADITDRDEMARIVDRVQPDECYNLAAQSFVGLSFDRPVATAEATGLGVVILLDTLKERSPHTRFYQASSSEIFGRAPSSPQDEATPFNPKSPYATSKLFGHFATINFREAFGLFACCGILFNHESPLREPQFVTRKIAAGLVDIRNGRREPLRLGNLNARRDWGFAGDYVAAIHQMLQQDQAEEFVIATGRTHSVKQFVEAAGEVLAMAIEWRGDGLETEGVDAISGQTVVVVDPQHFRAVDVDELRGNPSKAKRLLGWEPTTSFRDLVELMVRAEVDRSARTETLRRAAGA